MSIEQLLAAPRVREHLKRRLLAAGLLPLHCERCGISRWLGKALSLQLHHVNGDARDNRLESLQILCPNCHSETGTWGGRNGKRGGAPPTPVVVLPMEPRA
jgi:5-methylcytosine-specific restriction endonuclease McrA